MAHYVVQPSQPYVGGVHTSHVTFSGALKRAKKMAREDQKAYEVHKMGKGGRWSIVKRIGAGVGVAVNPRKLIGSSWQRASVRRVNGKVQVKINPTVKDLKRAGARVMRKVKRAVRRRR